MKKPKIIILGAGMSGISCALSLYESFDVHVYEKSRGVGGRLCAKTLNDRLFHFGAQFCKAKSSSLQNFLLENDAINFIGSSFDCEANDCVDTKNYFVGKRGMHALLKNYDQILNIKFNHRVVKIDEKNKLVHFESGKSESYDIIISSMPLPQAQKIYESKIEHDSKFSPCIAVGMTLNGTIDNQHNAYKNIDKDVAYLGSSHFYNDENKTTWVLQFSPNFSLKMLNEPDKLLQTKAGNAVKDIINGDYNIAHAGIFRWKYALCSRSNIKNEFTHVSKDAYAIGDWNISPRIESAYNSGKALGKFLTETKV